MAVPRHIPTFSARRSGAWPGLLLFAALAGCTGGSVFEADGTVPDDAYPRLLPLEQVLNAPVSDLPGGAEGRQDLDARSEALRARGAWLARRTLPEAPDPARVSALRARAAGLRGS